MTPQKQIEQFAVGDAVLALNVREGPKWYQATITQKLGINVYEVRVHELDLLWKRHKTQLISVPDVLVEASQDPAVTNDGLNVDLNLGRRNRHPPVRYGFD